MKHVILAVAAAFLLTNSIVAQELEEPVVPDYITRALQRDKDRAVDNFAKRMLDIDPDGNLSKETIVNYAKRNRATFRAAEMERFLRHDLDLDGVLTAAEIVDLKRFNKIDRRPDARIVFRILKADVNMDGQLSFKEMADAIIAETNDLSKYMRQTRDLQALFFFDEDKDGTVTLEEMLQGVQKLEAPCDC